MSLAQATRLLATPSAQTRNAEARIEAANRWIIEARPIIRAMFALEDIGGNLLDARVSVRGDRRWSEPETVQERTIGEAQGYVGAAFAELEKMLDGIRDSHIADQSITYPADDQDSADEINDRISDETISVKRAIQKAVVALREGVL